MEVVAITEAEVAIDGLLGRHEIECRYIERSCRWCGGLGLDAMVSNRISTQFNHALLMVREQDGYRLFLRMAAMEMYQTGAFAGAVLCQFKPLCLHADDLIAAGWSVGEGLRPKMEWACRKCGGEGGWGPRVEIG